MVNIFVGPELLKKAFASYYAVPIRHSFLAVGDVEVHTGQRLFMTIRGKTKEDDSDMTYLDHIPKRFIGFAEIYKVIYDYEAYKSLLAEKPDATVSDIISGIGVMILQFNKDNSKWVPRPASYFEEQKLYFEDSAKLTPSQRLLHKLSLSVS